MKIMVRTSGWPQLGRRKIYALSPPTRAAYIRFPDYDLTLRTANNSASSRRTGLITVPPRPTLVPLSPFHSIPSIPSRTAFFSTTAPIQQSEAKTNTMTSTIIQIPTSDGKTLSGTLYTPSLAPPPYGSPHQLPALILAPTFTATQLMGIQNWAKHFTQHLWLAVITFDSRGFGLSMDAGTPYEALPQVQLSDLQDVITFAASHSLIDHSKIALWGSGLSGGHVLNAAAIDKRVKAVISQTPMANGWVTLGRRVRYDDMPNILDRFAADRIARCQGKTPEYIPVVSSVATETCALPGGESFAHFNVARRMGGAGETDATDATDATEGWVNKVSVRSLEAIRGYSPEALMERISPTPLLMVVARDDRVCGTDLALRAYQKALEPKEIRFVDAGHYSVYTGEKFEGLVEGEVKWLKNVLGL